MNRGWRSLPGGQGAGGGCSMAGAGGNNNKSDRWRAMVKVSAFLEDHEAQKCNINICSCKGTKLTLVILLRSRSQSNRCNRLLCCSVSSSITGPPTSVWFRYQSICYFASSSQLAHLTWYCSALIGGTVCYGRELLLLCVEADSLSST